MLGLEVIAAKNLEVGDEIIINNFDKFEYLKVIATPSSSYLKTIKCSACINTTVKNYRKFLYEEDITQHNDIKYLPLYRTVLLIPKEYHDNLQPFEG